MAFISLDKAERKVSCQAFSACPLPTYLSCLPRAPLYHTVYSLCKLDGKWQSLSHKLAWMKWHFLWMTIMQVAFTRQHFEKATNDVVLSNNFFPALKKDGQLPFTSWLSKYFYLESKHLLLLSCLILWSTKLRLIKCLLETDVESDVFNTSFPTLRFRETIFLFSDRKREWSMLIWAGFRTVPNLDVFGLLVS